MKRVAVIAVLGAAVVCPAQKIETDVTGGWSGWNLRGNQNKFRQYATAPKDFFLRDFLLRAELGNRNDARLELKAPWEDDSRLHAQMRLNGGTTRAIAMASRNEFFDPNPAVTDRSRRQVMEGFVWQKATENLAISFRTRLDQLDETFEPLTLPLHQRTRVWTVAARGGLWKDSLIDLSYTDWRYWDRTDVLPDTTMRRVSASILQQLGENVALSGAFSRSLINQPGSATNKVDEWSVGGNVLLGDDTNLLLDYRNERLTLPTVLQAYDRSRQLGRARVVHRFGNGWSGQVGYSQLALERLRDDHTFVDVPRFHTVELQVSGRPTPSTRLTAKVSRQSVRGEMVMQTPDPRGLYWTSRTDAQVRLSVRNRVSSSYVTFNWHERNNSLRDVEIRQQGLTVGTEWNAKPQLEIYSELSTSLWTGRTSDPLTPDLNDFFPDALTFTTGANWTIDRRTWATANYTFFSTENANPLALPDASTWGTFFTGSLHYKLNDLELGLSFAPWLYSDRFAANRGFRTGLVQLTAKGRF